MRREGRQVRGGGRVRSLADLAEAGLDQFLDREPSPELAAQMADECRRLLDCLDDPSLRAVALAKMQGETNAKIAARLGCVEHTVERKLRRIRGLWTQECARLLGDDATADAEQQRAEAGQAPMTALDHFLLGEHHRREAARPPVAFTFPTGTPAPDRDRLARAIDAYRLALESAPDHYWSHCKSCCRL
jgi:hypothetical protein